MSEDLRVEQTNDGSPTLYSTHFKAHYHSTHGALQESQHVFIQEGLSHWFIKNQKRKLRILEFGIGTGLNVLLTLQYASEHGLTVHYHGVEAYPIEEGVFTQLQYDGISQEELIKFHRLPWNKVTHLSESFKIYKDARFFEKFASSHQFELVYYDAFAPSTQPYLWEETIVSKAVEALVPGGVLVTFCAKGSFKRVLRSLGMEVEGIPGPPGKREMTRAMKV